MLLDMTFKRELVVDFTGYSTRYNFIGIVIIIVAIISINIIYTDTYIMFFFLSYSPLWKAF